MLPGVTHQEAKQLAGRGLGRLPQLAEGVHARQQQTEKALEAVLGSASAARECAQVTTCSESQITKRRDLLP